MVSKILFIIFIYFNLFFFTNSYSNIIYDKKNIIITEIELQEFIKLGNNFNQKKLNEKEYLKLFINIKLYFDNLKKNNEKLLNEIDKNVYDIINSNDLEFSETLFYFLRYLQIKNQLILDYYNNKFSNIELSNILKYSELNLPISGNNCLTIEKVIILKIDQSFTDQYFNYIKNKTDKITIYDKDELFYVCLSESIKNNIQSLIVNYIETKVEKNLNVILYER